MILPVAKTQIESNVTETKQLSIANNDIIKQLLTSKLYSNPLQACLREYSANAIDACVEAKKPINYTVTAPTFDEQYLEIRDYGIGMDKDLLLGLFLQIGTSSKRESAELIGAYGIGRLSAFALSEHFTVTSYKNGRFTSIVMSFEKSYLLEEGVTSEPDGTLVQIPMAYAASISTEIQNFFELHKYPPSNIEINVQYIELPIVNNIQTYVVKRKTTQDEVILRLGGIPYSISATTIKNDWSLLPQAYLEVLQRHSTKIFTFVVDVPIGTLPLTTSRESIKFTGDKTDLNTLNDILKNLSIAISTYILQYTATLTSKTQLEEFYALVDKARQLPYAQQLLENAKNKSMYITYEDPFFTLPTDLKVEHFFNRFVLQLKDSIKNHPDIKIYPESPNGAMHIDSVVKIIKFNTYLKKFLKKEDHYKTVIMYTLNEEIIALVNPINVIHTNKYKPDPKISSNGTTRNNKRADSANVFIDPNLRLLRSDIDAYTDKYGIVHPIASNQFGNLLLWLHSAFPSNFNLKIASATQKQIKAQKITEITIPQIEDLLLKMKWFKEYNLNLYGFRITPDTAWRKDVYDYKYNEYYRSRSLSKLQDTKLFSEDLNNITRLPVKVLEDNPILLHFTDLSDKALLHDLEPLLKL